MPEFFKKIFSGTRKNRLLQKKMSRTLRDMKRNEKNRKKRKQSNEK